MEKDNKKSRQRFYDFLAWVIVLALIGLIVAGIYYGVKYGIVFLKEIAKFDAVVIVALITGGVSLTGVIISSIVGKSLEYKKSRNEYLAQKREAPYGDFVEMVYKVQQNTKQEGSYTNEEMIEDISKFSKQITLWGSPSVAKKWNEFRENGGDSQKATENLFVLEDIMNEMRKDLGTKKVEKGSLLSFFVNDIKDFVNKK